MIQLGDIIFIPNLQNTIWGQFNTISVLSLSLVYVALRKSKFAVAGICAEHYAGRTRYLTSRDYKRSIRRDRINQKCACAIDDNTDRTGLSPYAKVLSKGRIIRCDQGMIRRSQQKLNSAVMRPKRSKHEIIKQED